MNNPYPAEQWRPAPYPEYADCYAVSDYGRVKTLINTRHKRAGDLIALSANSDGYLYAAFFLKGTQRNFLVHRLVAKAFIGDCPDGMEIDHVDRDKTNNHISNLEYVTHFENIQRLGGKENIPTETIEAIRALYCDGWRRDELSLKFRLSIASIGRIVTNVRYYDPNYTYVKRYDPRTRERGAAKHTPPARTENGAQR